MVTHRHFSLAIFSNRPLIFYSTGCFIALFLALTTGLSAQSPPSNTVDYTLRDPLAGRATDNWLTPAAEFDRSRFYLSAGVGAATYGAASVGLYRIWYRDFEQSSFRLFNDWPEWQQMDKAGHVFTAYMFNRYAFAGLRWSGLRRPAARYTALGVANLLQATIETFDGFSAEWGFSLTDMGANLAGSLVFTVQDIAWREQRILLKVSNDLRPHPDDVVVTNASGASSTLGFISRERFGVGYAERFLKDYNAMTIWASVNPRAFLPDSGLPPWLNVAVGYGAEDVYGALGNVWRQDGQGFRYAPDRYRQYFLSPDLYLSRIPTRKRWVRLALGILDSFKVPAPALEFSRRGVKAHWLMW